MQTARVPTKPAYVRLPDEGDHMEPRPRSLRWRIAAASGGAVLAVGLVTAPLSAAYADDPPMGPTTPNAVAQTDNIAHLSNSPRPVGLDPTGAYNSDLAFSGNYAFAGN